jgi:hypothetical protein
MKTLIFGLLLAVPLATNAELVIKSGSGSAVATVDSAYSSLRVALTPRGKDCFAISETTGTMSASLAGNSTVFFMWIDPAGGKNAYVYRVVYDLHIVAAAAAQTQALNLSLVRGSTAAAASGGTAIATVAYKDPTSGVSQVAAAEGGDARISSTGALTTTGTTFETTPPFYQCGIPQQFALNAYRACIWDTASDPSMHPIELSAGQVLAIRNVTTAFPGTMTWNMTVTVEWCERT